VPRCSGDEHIGINDHPRGVKTSAGRAIPSKTDQFLGIRAEGASVIRALTVGPEAYYRGTWVTKDRHSLKLDACRFLAGFEERCPVSHCEAVRGVTQQALLWMDWRCVAD